MSLANYIENLLQADWPKSQVDPQDHREPTHGTELQHRERKPDDITYTPLSDLADALYDEDDANRFLKQTKYSWSMTGDQFRLLDLIRSSPALFPKGRYNESAIKEHWETLNAMVEAKRDTGELPDGWLKGVDVEFVLMNEKERIALYRRDPEEFTQRSQRHLASKKA